MSVQIVPLIQQDDQITLVKERAEELINLIKDTHPEARFVGPTYWAEENLWLIDAYFEGDDVALQSRLSERETDILLEEEVWLGVLCLPLDAHPA